MNVRKILLASVLPAAAIGMVALGNPNKVEGNTYTWLDGKPDRAAFTAVIENGALTSVTCL